MRARNLILICLFLLSAPFSVQGADHVCGEHDLSFACTDTDEPGRLRAGCGVREGTRFFASQWRVYDLKTEKILKKVAAGADGIALVEIPKGHWFILEGELVCSISNGELAIPYRFLLERTGKDSFLQRPYTPESLVATGNWNADTQLHYGAFRSRFLVGAAVQESTSLP